jgi:hypothetical protein
VEFRLEHVPAGQLKASAPHLGNDFMSRLLRWLAPLVAVMTVALADARAQEAPSQPVQTPQSDGFAYFVGILLMIVVMVIVCMPSRKRPRVGKDDD